MAPLDWDHVTFPSGTYASERPKVASRKYLGVTIDRGNARGVKAELRHRDGGEVVVAHEPADGYYVQHMLLEAPYLVIIEMDKQHAGKPDRMVAYELPSGEELLLDGQVPQPWSGLWSLSQGRLTYGTHGPNGGYCLTEVDLQSLTARDIDCVERGRGMSHAGPSPYGLGFTDFDHGPNGCPTAHVRRVGAHPVIVDDVRECRAWDVLPVGDDAVLWSALPRLHHVERAKFFVQIGDGEPQALGAGMTGSLEWCGHAAWFTGYATGKLMRWSVDDGLQEALHIPSRRAEGGPDAGGEVISAPTCGGDAVSFMSAETAENGNPVDILHIAPIPVRTR